MNTEMNRCYVKKNIFVHFVFLTKYFLFTNCLHDTYIIIYYFLEKQDLNLIIVVFF